MSFSVGALVRARGREWVVLPESDPAADLLVLRPLGGADDEVAGIDTRLEAVESAEFDLPDPERPGNHLSSRLLRDAVRLGFRSGAGPFRALSKIAVEPRPYQYVPLLMALRSDPVRLLIADDVGIGKTIEACLIARELLDRGEIQSLCVLCPPHLAEQWQRALDEQFHIQAALVLSGTASRLERDCAPGETLFARNPITVVSTDYIKSDRRRQYLMMAAPELVIVDEAHGCAASGGRSQSQKRHELLQELVRRNNPHLILVTATPHSGKEEAFRSLLGLLSPDLTNLPESLAGDENRKERELLARFLVQRRRGDLTAYLDTATPFPTREVAEKSYQLHGEYRKLFDEVRDYCRERIQQAGLGQFQQRVRWWAALSLLRGLSSSPRAAASTLRMRGPFAAAESESEVDDTGRRVLMDQEEEPSDGADLTPGAQDVAGAPAAGDGTDSPAPDSADPELARLASLAARIDALAGAKDVKLTRLTAILKELLQAGHATIVFCRFIPTVEYLVEHLSRALGRQVLVRGVTGKIPHEQREQDIAAMAGDQPRVLVCTDCLSEGVNLQDLFDAVIHYDLAWNPTRHEQREGRVDRYGQKRSTVRALTLYGSDNPIDGIVLDVLLRKHKAIQQQLGITVPVPGNAEGVMEAVLEGFLLRDPRAGQQLNLEGIPAHAQMELSWERAAEREKKSRSLFAQHNIPVNEVVAELQAVKTALGDSATVRTFCQDAMARLEIPAAGAPILVADLSSAPAALRDATGVEAKVSMVFEGTAPAGIEMVTRTHPVAAGLATYVLEAALDKTPAGKSPASRSGVIRTRAVAKRTVLLLLRMRFHLVTRRRDGHERQLLAEDVALLAFRGRDPDLEWLSPEAAEVLLAAAPDANTPPDIARDHIRSALAQLPALRAHMEKVVTDRGQALFTAHHRVRSAVNLGVRALRVEPHLPADVLGVYVYLPVAGGAA